MKRASDLLFSHHPIWYSQKLTLLLFFFSDWVGGPDLHLKYAIKGVALCGLLIPSRYLKDLWLWSALLFLFSMKTYLNWWTQDNHLFVLTYWCLAQVLAISSQKTEYTLSESARWLLGGTFFFATLWKGFLSPDFVDGTYFYFSFLTDKRFAEEALLFSGWESSQLSLAAFYQLRNESIDQLILQSSTSLKNWAIMITWWTVLIEGALAFVFLWPFKGAGKLSRHFLLLLFSWTTYFAMPITTFAWTLLSIGVSTASFQQRKILGAYFLTFILVLTYSSGEIQQIIYGFLQGIFY